MSLGLTPLRLLAIRDLLDAPVSTRLRPEWCTWARTNLRGAHQTVRDFVTDYYLSGCPGSLPNGMCIVQSITLSAGADYFEWDVELVDFSPEEILTLPDWPELEA